MSAGSKLDEARLSVLLDLRSPHCHLALHPAAALGSELGIEINWLPLRVPPLAPPRAPGPDDDRGTRHRRYRAEAIAREIETYARVQALELRDPYRRPDPSAFELGWLWMRDRRPDDLFRYLDDAFRRYWALDLDPSSEAEIAAIVGEAGDAAGFRTWCGGAGPGAAEALAGELRERGLFGVPGYLVEEEFFLGRQHLPMIRWILEGRQGPGPI